MNFPQRILERPFRTRDPPLQRSSSISAVIHGTPNSNCNHYIDALERFQRDHATYDKAQRQKKRQQKLQAYEKRRNLNLDRQNKIKYHQYEAVNKLVEKQCQSQLLHKLGAKKTAHTYGIPVNPINNEYEQNQKGRYQEYLDTQQKLNRLVRAHHITTCGNSGYNVINGRTSTQIDQLVPEVLHGTFSQKLNKVYQKYRLDPNQNPKKMTLR